MTKSDIVNKFTEKEGIKRKMSEEIIDIVFDSMRESLIEGKKVEVRGFGTFKIKDYKEYQGRNPRTGEVIDVQPKKLPFFKVGKELKEKLNS